MYYVVHSFPHTPSLRAILPKRITEATPMIQRKKVGVLISGYGGNLQALMDATKAADYPAQIVAVISNVADAYGLTRAKNAGIPAHAMPHKEFASRQAFDDAVSAKLQDYGVEIVCLAGFMRLLTPSFVQTWQGRLLNIHPSLLPSFKGAHAVRDALQAGVAVTGCTVHQVVAEVDAGPIILQAEVPILSGDSEDTLSERIHAQEHVIYPQALKMLAQLL